MKRTPQLLILILSVLAFSSLTQSPRAQDGDKPCKRKTLTISTKVLEKAAIKKVKPVAPKGVKADGIVSVQIDIDLGEGNVTVAEAISGPKDLQDVAVQAAKQWLFKPTEDIPCPPRITGVLNFDFSKK